MKPNLWSEYCPPLLITSEIQPIRGQYYQPIRGQESTQNWTEDKTINVCCKPWDCCDTLITLSNISLNLTSHLCCIKGLAYLWCSDKNDEQHEDWQQIFNEDLSRNTESDTGPDGGVLSSNIAGDMQSFSWRFSWDSLDAPIALSSERNGSSAFSQLCPTSDL